MKIALVLALAFCASALHLRTEAQTLTDPSFKEQVKAWMDVSPDEIKAIVADKERVKAKVHNLFVILDTDKSGEISLDELKAFFEIANDDNPAEKGKWQEVATEEFSKLDTDHSGLLDETEFEVFAADLLNEMRGKSEHLRF